ncbi:MAG: FixH family protein [Archangium sp.]
MKFFGLCVVVSLFACGPQPSATPDSTLRASATSGELTVELRSDEPLHVGQNVVRYRVLHDGVDAPHALITQTPRMQMIMGSGETPHGCPLKNPDHEPNADGFFEGLLVFTMPSSVDTRWSLTLEVELHHGAAPLLVDFGELEIADSTSRQFAMRDGQRVMLTAALESKPKLGANTFIVTAHRAEDAALLSWVPVTDLTFSVTPEMPVMGHGSSNNEAPVPGEDGLYRGTVNFMMAGDWVVHVGARAGDVALTTFDVPFTVE